VAHDGKVLRLAQRTAERHGAVVIAVLRRGTNHLALDVEVNGKRGTVGVASTPGVDETCIRNYTRQAVQRIAKGA
jgi:hypothetical protein